jgi:hypothetical protein
LPVPPPPPPDLVHFPASPLAARHRTAQQGGALFTPIPECETVGASTTILTRNDRAGWPPLLDKALDFLVCDHRVRSDVGRTAADNDVAELNAVPTPPLVCVWAITTAITANGGERVGSGSTKANPWQLPAHGVSQ